MGPHALTESGLNGQAVSKSDARGWFQFMHGTAKDYGLLVPATSANAAANVGVPTIEYEGVTHYDYRNDMDKSTRAAIRYLEDIKTKYIGKSPEYKELKKWAKLKNDNFLELVTYLAYAMGQGATVDYLAELNKDKDRLKILLKEEGNPSMFLYNRLIDTLPAEKLEKINYTYKVVAYYIAHLLYQEEFMHAKISENYFANKDILKDLRTMVKKNPKLAKSAFV